MVDSVEKYRISPLLKAAGIKLADSTATKIYTKHFSELTLEEKKKVLGYILVDDLGSIASSALKFVGPKIASYLFSKLQGTSLFQKAKPYLRDYLGIDLNDDKGSLYYPGYSSDVSM